MYARYVPSKKTKEAPKPAGLSPPPPPPPSAPESSSAPADDGLVSGGSTASPYARFVPSKSSKPRSSLANVITADTDGLSPATKRKHQVSAEAEEEGTQVKKKKSRKSEDGTAPDEDAATPKKSKKDKKNKTSRQDDEPTGGEPANGDEMDTRDEADRETESQETGEDGKKKMKKGASEGSKSETAAQEDGAEGPRPKKDKSKKKKGRNDAGSGDGEEDQVDARHKAVLAKATKYLKKAAESAPAGAPEKMDVDEEAAEEVEEHGLEPLPQPEPASLDTSKPSYETLPHWLAAPIRVAPDTRTPFADIGINPKAARALESKGFSDAFAVQTAAVPLLLPSCKHRQGDLLVAAATGSGKTLAYALPVVRDISQGAVTRLRALVVLPTRELVKQAQEVFELCAGAFDGRDQKRVRIGISIGSQQLRHEQAALVERGERYDPEAYRAARRRELEAWMDVEEPTALAGPEDAAAAGSLPDHVVDYTSKVDVLICTPGRLVEHINLTPGFSLDHVRWLVVDEADKLLAQSFQGWLDVVMPKLRTNKFSARDFPDSNLSGVVRKIVLSATLTRDLSLLSGLQLRRPQLIVLEGSQADGSAPIAEHTLPTLLKESAIRVHDANLKPLYLIDLLLGGHLMSETATKALSAPAAEHDEDNEDNDDTSSSDASSDTSSDAGSDSNSDTSSDSDSDSSSDDDDDSDAAAAATPKTKTARTLFTTTALIFTKSNESALRLSRLIALLEPSLAPSIATLTSTQKTSDRRRALRAFAGRRLRLLVASDLVARGVDLPLLDNVVNYDLPASAAGYVHRVGRTARAGRAGAAWTLVEDGESGWFWGKIAKPSSGIRRAGRVDRLRIGDPDAGGFGDERVRQYEDALEALGKEAGEARRHR
ncbi:P-loop containing nucleoside triphosphate hydrolase protein [Colletotrichum navitas]|uniref:ATP-dependent RNA helicase n=1 Tax=Colletotrichum navitas TaxID=681940 RepID=A0AAD8V6K8_9PEZI|nr:P-loop containing nucleoside triphosphate hydrolase protein [Colletotrichum navitas]KAK1593676.1 P-loop containing nucleoside triphosphate hydrolase protein [Colletotrichum navitas]